MKLQHNNKDAEQRGCERKLPRPSNVELGMKRRKRGLESAGAEIRGHYNILHFNIFILTQVDKVR